MTKPLCIYHGGCADGFTAAWAVNEESPNEFEFFAATYQDPPPDVTGRDVLIVDFSYKRPVLEQMATSAKSIMVLDHHKSAAEDLAHGGSVYRIADSWRDPGWRTHLFNTQIDENEGATQAVIYALFDMERSGAGIAWDFMQGEDGEERHPLVNYVEDRDLWRFRLPHSREINAYIFAHEYDFGVWSALAEELVQDLAGVAAKGAAIEKKHHKDVAELVAEMRREMVIGGHWVPVANLPKTLTSDAGYLLCAPYQSPNLQGEGVTPPFAACYWDTPAGRVFSLRSLDSGADVSKIAALYGGGGHRNAAGFRVPYADLAADGAPGMRVQ